MIVVSTVGLMRVHEDTKQEARFEWLGCNRYYETMVFDANKEDKRCHDAVVSRQIEVEARCGLNEKDVDDKANDMHEGVVREIEEKMRTKEVSYY